MKALKILGIIILLIVVVVVVLGLIAPSKLVVSKSIVIARSAAIIFPEVNDFKKWPAWSPWLKEDSTIQNTYSGNSEGVGAIVSWTSEKSDGGKQEIVESRPYEMIRTALELNDWGSVSYAEFNFDQQGDSTTVTWSFDGADMTFPFNAFNLFYQGKLETSYENGLKYLKEAAEDKKMIVIKDIGAEVFESELNDTQYIITMLDTTDPEGIQGVYERTYAAINSFMSEQGLEREAAPVGIYHLYSDSMVILEPGIPIASAVEVPVGMNMLEIPPTKVASATHVGPWENIGVTHESIGQWIEQNQAEMNGYPWHVYFNTLEEAGDPAKLYTQVHYPIK